jgi:hypothetical protein
MTIIKTLLSLVLCLASGLSHATHNYQDWWWNPAQSGMGLNVGQQNDTIFVAWFNYGDDNKASFLTMGGVLNGNTLTGTLFRGTGPVPGPNYNPALVKQTAVGTATLTFNSNTDATLTYSYDNKSGSMALQRFSFASPNFNQTWTVVDTYTISSCANASLNETVNKIRNVNAQQGVGANFTLTTTDLNAGNMCVAAFASQPAGSRLTATGTVACESSGVANVVIDDFMIQSDYLNFSYTVTGMSSDRSCIQKGTMSGAVKKNSTNTSSAFQVFNTPLGTPCFNVSDPDVLGPMQFETSQSINAKSYGCLIVNSADSQPVIDGNRSARFEVRPGDCSASTGWDDCPNDRSRHEINESNIASTQGQVISWETKVFVPTQPRLRPRGKNMLSLTQINYGDNNNYGTVAYLEVGENNELMIRTHVGLSFQILNKYVVAQNPVNRWVKVRYEIKSSANPDGYLKVYVDDVLAVDEQRVTLPSLTAKNYLKIGIYNSYKSMASEAYDTQVVYFDGLTKTVK